MINKVTTFISEVNAELKKVSWTPRKELFDSTWVVMISSFFLGAFIGLTDFVLSKFVGFIIN